MKSAWRALTIGLALVAGSVAAQDKPAPPAVTPAPVAPAPASASPAVESGSTVRVEYTLKDEAGIVLDSSKGRDPLKYIHGQRQIMPALERELVGMHVGDEKHVVVRPEDGYGHVNPDAQAEVPKEVLPPAALVVGTRLVAKGPGGETRPVMVKEIKDKTVMLDLNHPLAGKTLIFDLKVVGVEAPGSVQPMAPVPGAKPGN